MTAQDLRPLVEQQLALSRRLKARIQQLEAKANAPLAVVGMGLRLPGDITTPDGYWDFLNSDRDAITEIPDNRPGLRAVYDPQRDTPGKSYVNKAGFLTDVECFDARFFGLSKREAEAMDPQQRLLLETAWEAMERAGIGVRCSDRLPVGIFVGIMASEYGERQSGQRDKTGIDPYYGTGGGHCFAAGRVSYVMGFSGPAISVDTACSSSLVALHLAAQSLRREECRYAIVGGSNMLFSGDLMVSLCQSGALAPDGRSKTFTAQADGYGRGEGVGCIALMRLEDAQVAGHPVLAVLRGTATNHDGASSGLTVPNGMAQRDVIEAALRDAKVAPGDIGYVEAHGTGTALGDPIEVNALDAVLGNGAGARVAPLALGNVKTRIGHLEAAAGIAGVIKLVLSLQKGVIPAALRHSDGALSDVIDWNAAPIEVPRQTMPWPEAYSRRCAAISAFGLSGTNAHAIFEAPPANTDALPEAAGSVSELVVASARDAKTLTQQARQTAERLRAVGQKGLGSVAHTTRCGRAPLAFRVAVVGTSAQDIAHKLETASCQNSGTAPSRIRLSVGADTAEVQTLIDGICAAFPALITNSDQRDLASQLHSVLGWVIPRLRLQRGDAPGVTLHWNDSAVTLENGVALRDNLLSLFAQLYEAGADLRFDALRAIGVTADAGLGTYPFAAERFWIEEPNVIDLPIAAEVPLAQVEHLQPETDEIADFVHAELVSLLRADEPLDLAASFLEAGGDSFIAMLLKKAVEQKFQVDVPAEIVDATIPLSVMFSGISRFIQGTPIIEAAE
ncbi:beta-ketoacyl synthase N-terminal-like domain-containing protein [Palleronia caenipelagi]|uniref:Beta-ketoacyl synthase n=1 Tax=Palleronia caenipelagi TaxID=2489174 RepID=A0A547PUR8_9RHOB|nr:type I polyketide synthase [Palleronia caenipelagi]TRD17804.1 beta-ketoacyl synthase [Palleronia caenipelagi]